MGIPIVVRWHLYIESAPRRPSYLYNGNHMSKDGLNIGTGSRFQYKLNTSRNIQLALTIDPFKIPVGIKCQNLWYCTEIGNHNTINQASSNGISVNYTSVA